jgi:protein O-GlcNAc transferase
MPLILPLPVIRPGSRSRRPCRVVTLTICILACTSLPRGVAQSPEVAKRNFANAGVAMRAGTVAADRGDLREARQQFSRAVALAPQIAAAHAALGSVLLASGDPGAALRALERARRLGPTDAAVTLNLARTESLLRHYPESV